MLARADRKLLPRFGLAMLVVSSVAADLDFLSYIGGPSAFFRFHRGVLHSVLGSIVLVCALAAGFLAIDRRLAVKNDASKLPPLSFLAAVVVCAVGIAAHLVFDLASGNGVRLLWPFRPGWTAWNLLANLDPWVLALLALGLLLPEVFRLVSEEIGEREKGPRGQRAAVVAFLLLLIYVGARAELHSRAVDELNSREYRGAAPLDAGAFPSALSPFAWRGLVATDNTIEVMEISLVPGAGFDPDRAVAHYKPEDSAALEAAQNTFAARTFLRFAPGDGGADNIAVRVELSADLRVTRQEFRYANSAER